MAQVVNPIYDTVFKYLMQDEKVAKVLIGNILKTKVVSIQMNNNEYSAMLPPSKPSQLQVRQHKSLKF